MAHDDCPLRAIVATTDGGFEARLLDLDIAVRADTEDKLLREIEHAIIVTYEIALDLGETPFISVLRSEPRDPAWRENRTKMGFIELPIDVAVALAAVLRHPRPSQHIAIVKKAA